MFMKLSAAVLLLFVAGCASIMEGGDQIVNVQTTGCEDYGAIQCTVVNDDGSSILTAPASVNVEKDKDALTISCQSKDGMAQGEKIVESSYEAMNAGNLLLGGIIGVGVDAATGAMWKYPSSIIVPMRCPSKE